jgi:hypothetical protein
LRLKIILGNYTKGLNEIASLQPVRFVYKKDNPRQLPSGTEQVGFVAREVRKIFPEAVHEGEDGFLEFNMHSFNVAMVSAIKELKMQNEIIKAENDQLKSEILRMKSDFETRLSKVENMLETSSVK